MSRTLDRLEKERKKDRKGWHFWQTTEEARLLLREEMNRTQNYVTPFETALGSFSWYAGGASSVVTLAADGKAKVIFSMIIISILHY